MTTLLTNAEFFLFAPTYAVHSSRSGHVRVILDISKGLRQINGAPRQRNRCRVVLKDHAAFGSVNANRRHYRGQTLGEDGDPF